MDINKTIQLADSINDSDVEKAYNNIFSDDFHSSQMEIMDLTACEYIDHLRSSALK